MRKIDIACIIDDDPIFVFGTKRMMELVGFCNSFMIFHNGHEAIEFLRPRVIKGENLPEIILLDLNMPIMDGWQFLDELMTIPSVKKITIFIITSSIDPNDMEKVKKYGAVSNYFIKPINADQLKIIMEAM